MGILTKLEEKLEGNSKSKNPMRQQEHGIAEPGTVPLPSKNIVECVCPHPCLHTYRECAPYTARSLIFLQLQQISYEHACSMHKCEHVIVTSNLQ